MQRAAQLVLVRNICICRWALGVLTQSSEFAHAVGYSHQTRPEPPCIRSKACRFNCRSCCMRAVLEGDTMICGMRAHRTSRTDCAVCTSVMLMYQTSEMRHATKPRLNIAHAVSATCAYLGENDCKWYLTLGQPLSTLQIHLHREAACGSERAVQTGNTRNSGI